MKRAILIIMGLMMLITGFAGKAESVASETNGKEVAPKAPAETTAHAHGKKRDAAKSFGSAISIYKDWSELPKEPTVRFWRAIVCGNEAEFAQARGKHPILDEETLGEIRKELPKHIVAAENDSRAYEEKIRRVWETYTEDELRNMGALQGAAGEFSFHLTMVCTVNELLAKTPEISQDCKTSDGHKMNFRAMRIICEGLTKGH